MYRFNVTAIKRTTFCYTVTTLSATKLFIQCNLMLKTEKQPWKRMKQKKSFAGVLKNSCCETIGKFIVEHLRLSLFQ